MIALVHHVELAEAGWWSKAVQRFALAAVWLRGPMPPEGLQATLEGEFGFPSGLERLSEAVDDLCQAGSFVRLADGRIKLAESTRIQVEKDIQSGSEQETALKAAFAAKLAEAGVSADADKAWTDFEERLLIPLVQELGARTYELLVPGTKANGPSVQDLITKIGTGYDDAFRRAVISFLDPSDASVRSYVLRVLNAYFCVQAGYLADETLVALDTASQRKRELRVLLDTNFLFSVLRLHDNPSNEVAEALDALLARIRTHMSARLYVLPITIDEAKRVLRAHIANLSGVRLPSNLARAALTRTELTGLTKKFVQEASRSHTALTPDDFFGPYEKDLLPILRQRGVELFNEDMDPYRQDQDIIDDILAEEEFQKTRRFRGPKPYDSNLHDMILWHFVRRKRPTIAESPLDVGYWVVTEDFGLVGFDQFKRNGQGFPICLSAASLMQLLRFWLPRDEELERGLVASIRLPFLFPDFDAAAERVTTRILRSLSRYEGVEDLSVETIADILMSQALRQRLVGVETEAEEEALLRETFVVEAKELEQRLAERERDAEQARAKASTLEQQLADELKRSSEHKDELEKRADAERAAVQQMGARLSAAERAKQELAEEVSRIHETLAANAEQGTRRQFLLLILLSLVICAALGLGGGLLMARASWPLWVILLAAIGAGSSLWLLSVEWIAGRRPRLKEWGIVRATRRIRVVLLGVLGAVILGVLSSAVWDALKGR